MLVAKLNHQYTTHHKSFGILLHVFDYTENQSHKWLQCPVHKTCHAATHRDRWAGHFLYKGMPFANRHGNLPIFADGIRGGAISSARALVVWNFFSTSDIERTRSGCVREAALLHSRYCLF